RLGERGGEGVAEGVGGEGVEGLVEPYGPAPARRELAAFEVEELVGRDVVGQDEPLLPSRRVVQPHEDGGEDERVEDDVVLPDEVDQARLGPVRVDLPVTAPALG